MGRKRKATSLQEPSAVVQSRQAHLHTDVAPSGLGQAAATAPGRLARGPVHQLCISQPAAKWSPHAVPPSACMSCPAAAVELELARAAALDQLRHKLNSLCAKAGLRNVPLLAFERWRFAAKWAEDEPALAAAALGLQDSNLEADAAADVPAHSQQSKQASSTNKKQKQQPSDPVIPFAALPAAPEPGLVSDLIRSGLDADLATSVALQLALAASDVAAGLLKRKHQLVSGKPASCPDVAVSIHKHSLDLTCGGRFVKVSRSSYGKLARLYRLHWLTSISAAAAATDAAESTLGLPLEAAAAKLEQLEATVGAAADGTNAAGSSSAALTTADGDEDSDSDHDTDDAEAEGGDAGAAASGHSAQAAAAADSKSSSGQHHHTVLCAEARIAELEQQQQQQAGEGGPDQSTSERGAFHQRLFALLLRYKSIQGHGFQAAAGPSVFELLRQKLSVGFECFASPLNSHFSRYGSAFPDVDGPFGSAGSFFRMHFKHGSYEVNPPFVPSILTATAQHILQQLHTAESAGGALSFVVLLPGWEEVEGWQMLNSSTFLKQSLVVAAADHGYCDGASHQRKDLYRQSPYDSGVLFLQTSTAAKKWPVTDVLVSDLRAALAQCCPTAAAVERQKKQRGQTDLEWQGLVPGRVGDQQQQQQVMPNAVRQSKQQPEEKEANQQQLIRQHKRKKARRPVKEQKSQVEQGQVAVGSSKKEKRKAQHL